MQRFIKKLLKSLNKKLILILILLTFIGAGAISYYQYTVNKINTIILEYYKTTDQLNCSKVAEAFFKENPEQQILITNSDFTKPTAVLLYKDNSAPKDQVQYSVHTFDLQRTGVSSFKVINWFSSSVTTSSMQNVVETVERKNIIEIKDDPNIRNFPSSIKPLEEQQKCAQNIKDNNKTQDDNVKLQAEFDAASTQEKIKILKTRLSLEQGKLDAYNRGEKEYAGEKLDKGSDLWINRRIERGNKLIAELENGGSNLNSASASSVSAPVN